MWTFSLDEDSMQMLEKVGMKPNFGFETVNLRPRTRGTAQPDRAKSAPSTSGEEDDLQVPITAGKSTAPGTPVMVQQQLPAKGRVTGGSKAGKEWAPPVGARPDKGKRPTSGKPIPKKGNKRSPRKKPPGKPGKSTAGIVPPWQTLLRRANRHRLHPRTLDLGNRPNQWPGNSLWFLH